MSIASWALGMGEVPFGQLVSFDPGEVKVLGSDLFQDIGIGGVAIQASVDWPGSLSIISRDAEEKELSRLSDLPGRITGGLSELWFSGAWPSSPLSFRLGPIRQGVGGSVQMEVDLHKWDGVDILHLPYFDRMFGFFTTLVDATQTEVRLERTGTPFLVGTFPLHSEPFVGTFRRYLEMLDKATRVLKQLKSSRVYALKAFDAEAQNDVEEMYDILFESGCTKPTPDVRVSLHLVTHRPNALKALKVPRTLTLASTGGYKFMGEDLILGSMINEFTEMALAEEPKTRTANDEIEIVLVGTKKSVRTMRLASENDDTRLRKLRE